MTEQTTQPVRLTHCNQCDRYIPDSENRTMYYVGDDLIHTCVDCADAFDVLFDANATTVFDPLVEIDEGADDLGQCDECGVHVDHFDLYQAERHYSCGCTSFYLTCESCCGPDEYIAEPCSDCEVENG